ncbi:MAG TPA: DinB family protein, partial [Longimicrobiales bacterium]|nr:DinB family protein [Longimicrobiales bacterium]
MSLKKLIALTAMLAAAVPGLGQAQQNPLTDNGKMMHGMLKLWVSGAAEKMPEADFMFKPTADVRAFGQIVGHIADMQYHFCSALQGEADPKLRIEKTATSKAEVLTALKAAFTYCDKAFSGFTDQNATQAVKLDGRDFPRLGVMTVNSLHT